MACRVVSQLFLGNRSRERFTRNNLVGVYIWTGARTSSLSFSSPFLVELGLTQNSAQTALLLLDNISILSTTTYMISQSRVSCYNSTNLGDLWVQPGAVGQRGSWRIESDYTKREQMSVLPSHSKDSRVTEKVLSFAGDGSQLWRGVSLPNTQ